VGDVQILGPILVAGAVVSGALIVSLFVTPRPSTASDLGDDVLYVATADSGQHTSATTVGTASLAGRGFDGGGDGPTTEDREAVHIPLIPLVPAMRVADSERPTKRATGVLERFVGEGGVDALRTFVEQFERIAIQNAGS
jgi:hypothetical protein